LCRLIGRICQHWIEDFPHEKSDEYTPDRFPEKSWEIAKVIGQTSAAILFLGPVV